VRATSAAANSSALLDIIIPVRQAGEPLVKELSVMSYNLWYGGTRVNNYHPKQVRYLADSGADIIGVQESAYNGQHATRLAAALGWYSWQGRDVGFISRYPIVATSDDGGYIAQARIALDGDRSQVSVWNAHLHSDPYGPYDFCFDHMTVEEVLGREVSSNRAPQMDSILSAMVPDLADADNTPVILLGDMNAPSHLDWTEALKDKNCGYANVAWPTSLRPIEAGLVDTFRVIHPNPVAKPGITWSPIDIKNANGQPEPLDRIDFIYHKGTMAVVDSKTQVVGKPKPSPDYEDNKWTSDHAAVVTKFRLKERKAPLVLSLVSSRVQLAKGDSDECEDN
jgi:endonuclease/exonuclease/phosphatase family metal-dependent hydrolase